MDIEKIKKNKTTKELLEFGIINIDKSSGPTSFNVSDFVRKSLGLRKTSHFGTLDPKVTGVLPIALNRGCKLTGYFLGEDKEYIGIMRIHEDVDLKKIKEVIKKKFIGVIKQIPPVKSRVKRQEREREVKKFELIERGEAKPLTTSSESDLQFSLVRQNDERKLGQSKEGKNILFRAEVQGGTYIRKLIDDLGKELGVGAHMLELRRVRAGIFLEDSEKYPSVNLYDFEKAVEEYFAPKGVPSVNGAPQAYPETFPQEMSTRGNVNTEGKGNDKLLRKIIIPGEIVSELHPVVEIKKDRLQQIFTGKPIKKEDLITHHGRTPKDFQKKSLLRAKNKIKKGEIIIVFCENKFVGIYKTILSEHIFAKSEFVMQPMKD